MCIPPAEVGYDHDDDPETALVSVPSCVTLPNVDTDADGIPQHEQFGCAPRSD